MMRIAVPYLDGEVFGHFGKAESFKIYDVEGGSIVSSEIVATNASGHSAMAEALVANNVDVLICGGIGGHSEVAVKEAGIKLCSGAEGKADDVVEAYLNGETFADFANCSKHNGGEADGEGCGCGCGCGDGEGGCGCGGCGEGDGEGCGGGGCGGGGCGGCGGRNWQPIMEGKNVMKTVRTHYRGTFNDGTVFDSSYDRGEPLEFLCGVGQMIRGYDQAVANMEVGESVDIHLMPSEAYGEKDPNAVFDILLKDLPGAEELTPGQHVYLSNAWGQPVPVVVIDKDDTYITFDANHEMAGKELNFHIELVEIKD